MNTSSVSTAAKRVLSVAVYNHYKRIKTKFGARGRLELDKSNILLSGTDRFGQNIAGADPCANPGCADLHYRRNRALTEAGYVGEDVENILLRLDTGGGWRYRPCGTRRHLH